MSLNELTRNSFQSGISATKWLSLAKLFISKHLVHAILESIPVELSNSILVLFRNYPGDPSLQGYLRVAIQDGLLPLPVFVSTFLSGARSPEFHNLSTLDMLCRIALESHYSSGRQPDFSVVPPHSPINDILGTVQDAMNLLRTAHSMPSSHFHQLNASASKLLMLLLSCTSNLSQLTTAQAMIHFANASDILQLRLNPDIQQAIETHVLSLSLLLGDDAKAAREAQMMHNLQLALGKGDIVGPNSDTDIVSCGLLLHSLVARRAGEFGSGDGSRVTALLVATIRWSSWSASVFYTQFLLAAFTGLAQAVALNPGTQTAMLWRAFVSGRLPHLLSKAEKAVELDGTTESDWRAAMQTAVSTIMHHHVELLRQCDGPPVDPDGASDSLRPSASFAGELLHQLLAVGLIDAPFLSTVAPNHPNEFQSRVLSDARESGVDLEAYLDSKIPMEGNVDDVAKIIDKVWRDPCSHATFAEIIRKRFTSATTSLDVESLSYICKVLYTHEPALEMVALHTKLSELLALGLALLEDYDCETVGDPQTAVSHLGDIVLFLQSTLVRYNLSTTSFFVNGRRLTLDLLHSAAVAYRHDELGHEDVRALSAWAKALFDSNSEGIEDTILRSTKPKQLLRIAASLFSNAIALCMERKMDKELLNNGVSYFLGPLLSWTLTGVIKALLSEIQHRRPLHALIHMDVLQTLLRSPSCPPLVLRLSASAILRIIPQPKPGPSPEPVDFASIRRVAIKALGLPEEELPTPLGPSNRWNDPPRGAIREALTTARAGRAPSIDIDHSLLFSPPTEFLTNTWSELVSATSTGMGDIETPRRIATFILSTPRSSSPRSPPLLPIFLHVILPPIVSSLDGIAPPEQTVVTELIVATISSALTAALHTEWALLSVCNEQRYVLGHSTAGMARRLGADLRKGGPSSISGVIFQRLSSSQSFVTNFPTFTAEI